MVFVVLERAQHDRRSLQRGSSARFGTKAADEVHNRSGPRGPIGGPTRSRIEIAAAFGEVALRGSAPKLPMRSTIEAAQEVQ